MTLIETHWARDILHLLYRKESIFVHSLSAKFSVQGAVKRKLTQSSRDTRELREFGKNLWRIQGEVNRREVGFNVLPDLQCWIVCVSGGGGALADLMLERTERFVVDSTNLRFRKAGV